MRDKARILIVDDEPSAKNALEILLAGEPYELDFASNGREALVQVEQCPPDVILLDVMMPEMTGYETCARLKADGRWRHIPVTLVTALGSKQDMLRGLEAGADEFLTKPVNGPELRARVRTMLRIKRQHDDLQETLRLREEMADMIVHDMRSPLSTILVYSDLLLRTFGQGQRNGHRHSLESVETIRTQSQRLNDYLNDLLMMARMQAGKLVPKLAPVDVNLLLTRAMHYHQPVANVKGVELVADLPEMAQEHRLDYQLMLRTVDNLLSNALKFSPPDSCVTVRLRYRAAEMAPAGFCLQVIDQGPGVAPEHRERIFDKYEVVALRRKEIPQLGLGLALCKWVVEAHGGRIGVAGNRPTGAIFWIEM